MRFTRQTRVAVLAFGTRGDVEPIAVVAGALAKSDGNWAITFITHSEHEFLKRPLALAGVSMISVSSAPVSLPPTDSTESIIKVESSEIKQCKSRDSTQSGAEWKISLDQQHRQECMVAVEQVLGEELDECGDFIMINFFALEGWHIAEHYHVPCMVAAPYVVPYSAPSSFEREFSSLHPSLYRRLKQAQSEEIGWGEVSHWMWPLFSNRWTEWRLQHLHLSACPLTDPVTGLPLSNWPRAPPLLYGCSPEVIECPGYWPKSVHVCGFLYPPSEWVAASLMDTFLGTNGGPSTVITNSGNSVSLNVLLRFFSQNGVDKAPIFVGLSSIGSMGFMTNPRSFLLTLLTLLDTSGKRAVLFTSAYSPLDLAIIETAMNRKEDATNQFFGEALDGVIKIEHLKSGILLSNSQLLCFSGSVPYSWLFSRCSMVIHHGGSGTTAAALRAGIPQIICPFVLDQFYWAERMAWIGVAPEALESRHLFPETAEQLKEAVRTLSYKIAQACSIEMQSCASSFAEKLQMEDGIGNFIKVLHREFFTKGLCSGGDGR